MYTYVIHKYANTCVCYRHLVLLECALEKLDDHNSCVVPEQLTEQNSTCCMRENDVIFLAAKFRCCMSTISNDLSRLDKSCKTLRLLLQLVNTLSIQANHLKILHRMPQLLESTVGMCIYVSDNYCLTAIHCYVMQYV